MVRSASRALLALALTLVVVVVPSRSARAGNGPALEHGETLLKGVATEVGGISQTGRGEFAATAGGVAPNAQGLVLRDRNGLTSRVVFGILVAVSSAMAASGSKSV